MKKILALNIVLLASIAFFALAAPTLAEEQLLGKFDGKSPIDIEADKFEVMQADSSAKFTGNVVVVQNNVNLQSDEMTVKYAKNQTSDKTEITTIEVNGNVKIRTAEESASGNYGVYDTRKKLIQLIGNVRLNKDDNVLTGDKLVFFLDEGYSKLSSSKTNGSSGRVKATFTPAQ